MRLLLRLILALLCLLLLTLGGLALYAYSDTDTKPQLFLNGTVLKADGSRAEALLVENGRITAIGDQADLIAAAPANVERFDLAGGSLMAGLVEPHTHPIASGLLGATVDVSGFSHNNRAEVMATLENAVNKFSPNGWVIAFGWDPVMLADLEAPSLAELDKLSPDKPLLILTQMMHDAYANSAALAAANITSQTPNPQGGEFIKNAAGELTGTIREVSAINVIFDAVPKPPSLAVSLLTQLQLQRYAKAGYTSIGILGPVGRAEQPLGLLEDLLTADAAPLRAQTWALPTQLSASAKPHGNERYGLRGVKFWMDGSPFAGGAAWDEPYENSELVLKRLELPENHQPHLNYDLPWFEQQFANFHQRGFAIAVHVQGERAITAALDVAERVLAANPRPDHGHRLEHNALITTAQIKRAKALSISLSFFVDHVWFYGHRLPELIAQRVERYMPLATAVAQGHRISFHGDHPATPVKPFRSLKTAVTRHMRSADGQMASNQAISVAQGLKAMTIDAAWQLGIDKNTGSLEVGKAADLVWLSANPLALAPEQLDEIEVQATWLDGRPVNSHWFSPANAQLLLNALF